MPKINSWALFINFAINLQYQVLNINISYDKFFNFCHSESFYIMKTTPHNSFLKFYVMTSTGINLFGIAHVKVDIILPQKMYVKPTLGRFV